MKSGIIKISAIFFGVVIANLSWAQTSFTVRATQTTPRTFAAYQFVFTTEQELPANAEIEIIFPSYFILSKVVLADSRTISGGFSVAVNGDTVRVKRSGLGSIIPRGRTVDLLLASIINPREMAPEYEFTFSIAGTKGPAIKKKYMSSIAEIKAVKN